jgi:NADPH:quinone reductase
LVEVLRWKLMRQIQLNEYGPPSVLHAVEVSDPTPGAGHVLVRTEAAGITFVETQVRAGRSPRPGPPPEPPLVLGNGVEGTVEAVGPGVDRSLLGRRVVTATGGLGGYAEQVVVDAADPYPVPDGLALGEAVALLADGRTAIALARAAAIEPGDRVLVTAAAGGVGSLLVQLARTAGAKHVVAAASSDAKLALSRTLGADVTVNYASAGWGEELRDATGGLDVALDGVGGDIGREALALVVTAAASSSTGSRAAP